MEAPCFDEVLTVRGLADQDETHLVIHRNVAGGIAYAHTPMDATKMLLCEICYSGVRVWLNPA